MSNDLVIVLCDSAQAGAIKPRLTPPLTGRQADAVRAAMLLDMEAVAATVPGMDIWYACPGAPSEGLCGMLGPATEFLAQSSDAFGDRLIEAFGLGFERGYQRVVILAADSPDLPPSYIQTAMSRLSEDAAVAVFGPTLNGGYYLAALSRPRPELFTGALANDPTAFLAARAAASRAGIPVAILPRWQSVDDWTDLRDCIDRGAASHLIGLYTHGLLTPCADPLLVSEQP